MGTLSSRLVEHQGSKKFNKFYSYLELCIASISFSTVFLRTGIYEETISMVFSPYNFTFTVLFCKQIIKKRKKEKKKEKSYVPRNLTSPLRRIREHREKYYLHLWIFAYVKILFRTIFHVSVLRSRISLLFQLRLLFQ